MACLVFGEIAVHVIQVADERTIIECRPIGRGPSSADQAAERIAAKIIELLANRTERFAVESADRAPKGVENTDLKLLTSVRRQVIVLHSRHKRRKSIEFCRHVS